jgi:hypothetical protein|tara:strand:- start:1756 stop:1923 length:168 start_codon:yes stop_codon:yes gene_type:complete
MGYSQAVRPSFLVRVFKGSNPFIPKFEVISSMVERLAYNEDVGGSSPLLLITKCI